MDPTRNCTLVEHLLRAVDLASVQLKIELNRGLVPQVSNAGTQKLSDSPTTTRESTKKKRPLKPCTSRYSSPTPNRLHRIGCEAYSHSYDRKTLHNVNTNRDRYLSIPITKKPAPHLRCAIRVRPKTSTTKSGFDISSAPVCSNTYDSALPSMPTPPHSKHNSAVVADMGFDQDCEADDERSVSGENEWEHDDGEM